MSSPPQTLPPLSLPPCPAPPPKRAIPFINRNLLFPTKETTVILKLDIVENPVESFTVTAARKKILNDSEVSAYNGGFDNRIREGGAR